MEIALRCMNNQIRNTNMASKYKLYVSNKPCSISLTSIKENVKNIGINNLIPITEKQSKKVKKINQEMLHRT